LDFQCRKNTAELKVLPCALCTVDHISLLIIQHITMEMQQCAKNISICQYLHDYPNSPMPFHMTGVIYGQVMSQATMKCTSVCA
jgi:hypothetical protein